MDNNKNLLVTDQWKEDCEHAAQVNLETLLTIVRDNENTEFGKTHEFSEIHNADEYRSHVPLSEYEDYITDIDRIRKGENNILFSYPLYGFANSSGTTSGNRKWIPITRQMIEAYGNDPDLYAEELLRKKGGKRIHLSMFRTNPDEPFESLVVTGIYYRYKYLSGRMDMDSYVGGRALFFDPDPGDVLFAKTYAALSEEHITVMETVFQYDYLHFFHYIEMNYQRLLDIMRSGKIPEDITLSAPIRKTLSELPVSAERIEKLEREFAKGFKDIAKRIWPSLSMLGGISNVAFFAEEENMKPYVGDIPRHNFTYAASECYYGDPVDVNVARYAMMPRHDFFEFLPYDETSGCGTETVLPEESETGKTYEVVITNFAGLYRYRMSDIVRVVDFCGQSPVVEFVTRRGLSLSLAGEKVSLLQVEEAIRDLEKKQVDVEMFCFSPDIRSLPGHYFVAMVTKAGCKASEKEVSVWIDASLKRQNWDYEDLRNLGQLSPPIVRFLSMTDYMDLMEKSGLTAGQNKPKHIALKGLRFEEMNS